MIIQNEIECKKCKDKVYSASRHDFKSCKCGSIAVDGGMDYLKRVGDIHGYEERSMSMDEAHLNDAISALEWATTTGRNPKGIVLAIIRSLRDNGYLNMDKFRGT